MFYSFKVTLAIDSITNSITVSARINVFCCLVSYLLFILSLAFSALMITM